MTWTEDRKQRLWLVDFVSGGSGWRVDVGSLKRTLEDLRHVCNSLPLHQALCDRANVV